MADLAVPFRKAARAILTETGGTTVRRAVQGYVLPEISSGRYHYLRDQFALSSPPTPETLNGKAPDEGPIGATWTASNWNKGVGNLLTPAVAATDADCSIDAGASDGFLSFLVNTSATPNTDSPLTLGFRMASSSWTTVGGTFRLPSSGWGLVYTPSFVDAFTVALYLDGVGITPDFGITIGPAPMTLASQHPLEVRLNGSNIQVWHNGVVVLSHTDATHQASTRVGTGRFGSAALSTATIDDLFFASVPTCPLGAAGLTGDSGNYVSTANTLDAGAAAGAILPLHLRYAKLGAPLSNAPVTVSVGLLDDAGTQLHAIVDAAVSGLGGTTNGYGGPTTWNLYATANGNSGGGNRVGTFRQQVRMRVAGAGVNWTIDSENLNTLNATTPVVTTNDAGKGYASVPVAASSVQKPSTTQKYLDASTLGLTLATQPWRAGAAPTIVTSGTGLAGRSGAGGSWASGVSSRTDSVNNVYGSLIHKSADITTTASTTLTDPYITPGNTPIGTHVHGFFAVDDLTVTATGTGSCTVSAALVAGTGSVFYYSANTHPGGTFGLRLAITMAAQSALNSDPAILLNGTEPADFDLTTAPTNEAGFTTVDSVTNTAYNVNAWLTVQRYMQLGTTAINTPPDGTSDSTFNLFSKLPSDVGEITHRVKDFSGAGVNGVGFTAASVTLTDSNRLVAAIARAGNTLSTATLGGAVGWLVGTGGLGGASPNFLPWANSNPGGRWIYEYTISTAGATGLASPPIGEFANNAIRPQFRLMVAGGASSNVNSHFKATDTFRLACWMFDMDNHILLLADTPPTAIIQRIGNTGQLQYLRSDTLQWVDVGAGGLTAPSHSFTLAAGPTSFYTGDAIASPTNDADPTKNWTVGANIQCAFVFTYQGALYINSLTVETVGASNHHNTNEFDGTDFATGFPFK